MRDRETCVDCGRKSPETETNYTLISSQFGWRLLRYQRVDGVIVVEWRCPGCWREYKKARESSATFTRQTPPAAFTPRSEPPSSPRPAVPRPTPKPPRQR
jgi:hypothetical protein